MDSDLLTAEPCVDFTTRERRLWSYFRDFCRFNNDISIFFATLYSDATKLDVLILLLRMQQSYMGFDEGRHLSIELYEKARNAELIQYGYIAVDENIDLYMYKIEFKCLPKEVTELSRYCYLGEWISYNEKENSCWKGKRHLKILIKCLHGKRKAQCKPCGGSAFCEHGKHKFTCRPCGGSIFCEHGKHKFTCKQCGGSAFCEHGKRKIQCEQCKGSALCEHGKRKSYCKPCGGSALCDHGIRKARCKPCGGSALCEHGKLKVQCTTCSPVICSKCHQSYSIASLRKHSKRCKK